jgi:hypothetical protein
VSNRYETPATPKYACDSRHEEIALGARVHQTLASADRNDVGIVLSFGWTY